MSENEISKLIASHRPPKLRQSSTPSVQSFKATTSESQKRLLMEAGHSGLIFTHQSDLLDRLSHGLEEACLDSSVPEDVLAHWNYLMIDHRRYHENATVHNEIYLLHPVYDHQLFHIVHFLVTYNLDRFFKPDRRPAALDTLTWRRYRHASAGVNTGIADAMLVDEFRRLFAIMEIKFPSSPGSEDGDDLANALSVIQKARSPGGLHLKSSPSDQDWFSISPDVPPIMGQHLLQVSAPQPPPGPVPPCHMDPPLLTASYSWSTR